MTARFTRIATLEAVMVYRDSHSKVAIFYALHKELRIPMTTLAKLMQVSNKVLVLGLVQDNFSPGYSELIGRCIAVMQECKRSKLLPTTDKASIEDILIAVSSRV